MRKKIYFTLVFLCALFVFIPRMSAQSSAKSLVSVHNLQEGLFLEVVWDTVFLKVFVEDKENPPYFLEEIPERGSFDIVFIDSAVLWYWINGLQNNSSSFLIKKGWLVCKDTYVLPGDFALEEGFVSFDSGETVLASQVYLLDLAQDCLVKKDRGQMFWNKAYLPKTLPDIPGVKRKIRVNTTLYKKRGDRYLRQ